MRAATIVITAGVSAQWMTACGVHETRSVRSANTEFVQESTATRAPALQAVDSGQLPLKGDAAGSPLTPITKQRVTFQNGELALTGMLFKPNGPGPFPAIVWNHGSEKNPDAGLQFDTVARIFVPAGYVVFAPMRRGQGSSGGAYIVDRIDVVRKMQGIDAANRETVQLMQTEQLDDQLAGLWYLKSLAFVDSSRVVVAGCSYGGIESLMAAERSTDYKAAIAISPAALSWQHNPELRRRLVQGVRDINIPVLLLQPAKDASLEPSAVLGKEFKRLAKPYSGKIYPAVGPRDEQGHCFGGAKGMHVWAQDVLEFVASVLR
jgi:dienelactone hydrolase